jgi:hypothetical protein
MIVEVKIDLDYVQREAEHALASGQKQLSDYWMGIWWCAMNAGLFNAIADKKAAGLMEYGPCH